MSFGIDATGFRLKRIEDILLEIYDALDTALGEPVDREPDSFTGQLVGVFAEREALLWELLEAIYFSQYPNSATGIALDNVLSIIGLTRQGATPSIVEVVLGGTAGVVVPAGSRASVTGSGELFETQVDATIGAGGTVTAIMHSVNDGEIEALAGSIVTIETPVFNWDTVINLNDADEGTEVETDEEFKLRAAEDQEVLGGGTPEAIRAALRNLQGVQDAFIAENVLNDYDIEGRPAHSFEAIVGGGTDSEILEELWLKKPAGIDPVSTAPLTISVNDVFDSTVYSIEVNDVLHSVNSGIGATETIILTLLQDSLNTGSLSDFLLATLMPDDTLDVLPLNDGDAMQTAVSSNLLSGGSRVCGLVADSNGDNQFVCFSRPVDVLLYVEIDYIRNPEETFPADGEQQIIDALVDFGESFQIGEDIIYTKFFGVVHQVQGISGVVVRFDTVTPAVNQANISIDANEIGSIDSSRITVLDIT